MSIVLVESTSGARECLYSSFLEMLQGVLEVDILGERGQRGEGEILGIESFGESRRIGGV